MTKVSFPLLLPEEYLVPYKVVLQWRIRRIVRTSLITRPFFSLFHMQTASRYNIFFQVLHSLTFAHAPQYNHNCKEILLCLFNTVKNERKVTFYVFHYYLTCCLWYLGHVLELKH